MASKAERKVLRPLDRSLSTQCSGSVDSAYDSNHGETLLKGIQALREEGKYCDIVLITNKKNKIPAHRLVLTAFSKYFQDLLGPNFKDGKQNEIEIFQPDGSVLQSLINFAYSGKIDISTENVYDLLDGARFLDFEFVVKACSDFLNKAAGDDEVCIDVLQIADRFHLQEPRQAALKHILRHFVKICVEGEDVLELQPELFVEIIQQEGIWIEIEGVVPPVENREQAVLQSLIRYVKHDPESRIGKFAEFFTHVRVDLVSTQCLEEARAECIQAALSLCADIIGTVINSRAEKVKNSVAVVANGITQKPREFAICVSMEGPVHAGGRQVNTEIEHFNDEDIAQNDDVFVKGMKMWIRRWDGRPVLGGIQVHYSNEQSAVHGSSTAQEFYEFNLGKNERIVSLDIRCGWMIDRLTFYTNKVENGQRKSYGPYGGDGGGEYSETFPKGSLGFLSWVKGTVVETQGSLGITRLQFQWKSFLFPDEEILLDKKYIMYSDDDTDSYSFDDDEYSDHEW